MSDNLKTQFEFLDHRRQQEIIHFNRVKKDDPMQSLLSVEINCTELCNRTCVFCPRHDASVYPNQNLNMPVALAEKIADQLQSFDYQGKISFSGYGENLLNRDFAEIVAAVRARLNSNVIECNTNGDRLTPESAQRLYDAGLTNLYVNLYDGEHQRAEFESVLKNMPADWYVFRKHWDPQDHGLILNNRGGTMTWVPGEPHPGRPCYYTSYKMMIDWNGNVLFCSNDWARDHIVGNVYHHHVKDIWLGEKMTEFRRRLGNGDRAFKPCNGCSVNGDLFGRPSFELLSKTWT